jgi:hypothetical protein
MHVKRIKSNIKGGVDQELGQKTLIVGPNGHGKSAIVNAVELALGGTASDIVGRAEVKRESDLLALSDGSYVSAEAEFSDGRNASYKTVSNNRGGAKKADHICPVSASFPVRDVRAALGGSADTARSWLLEKVVTDVTREDVVAWFTPEAATLYQSMSRPMVGEITNLLNVVTDAGKECRSSKKRLKSDQELLERLGSNLDAEPTEQTLAQARKAADDSLAAYEDALRASGRDAARGELTALRQNAEDLIDVASKGQSDWNEVLALTPPGDRPSQKEAELIDRVQALKGIHQMHIDLDVDEYCLVCEQSSVGTSHKGLLVRKDQIVGQMEHCHSWWAARDQVGTTFEKARKEAETAISHYHSVRDDLESIEVDAQPLPQAKSAWEGANMKKVGLEAAEGQWRQLRSQKDIIRETRTDIANLEDLIESGKQAINRLLKTAISTFSERVQGFLPEQDTFRLVLEEDGKEVCRFGFERGGKLHTALSGAEWARLTLALACAAVAGQESEMLVFTPEERAFDPVTLRNVMAALSEAPGQVLLTSPIKHKGRLPKGWTVLEIGNETLDSTQNEQSVSLSM